MKYALALVVAAGIVASASAQNTQLILESQINGDGNWSSLRTANVGDTVQVRVRAALVGDVLGTGVGLAGFTFMPELRNTNDSDTVATPNGALGIADASGNDGRIAPYALTQQITGTNLLRAVDLGSTIRFGGSGAATGSPLTGGVLIGQAAPFSPFGPNANFSQDLDPTVFKFSFVVGAAHAAGDTLIATAPLNLINQGGGRWYNNLMGSTADLRPSIVGIDAAIVVVPAPCALALLGLGGLVATRRRRA